MSFVGYPIPYTKFKHIHFYAPDIRVNADLWPWPLTFQPKTISFLAYPKVIPYTKFEHFWIIRFLAKHDYVTFG